jgi:myo-inositol-1(or 4)-monophosphatase
MAEGQTMKTQLDWQRILAECHFKLQASIVPYLSTIREPQPSLGIGAGGDIMKPIDLVAETAIVDTLKGHGISFTLISEESGIKHYCDSQEGCYVTVDPIDGTTNLIHGLPFYASSIAVSSKPELPSVYAAMVADLAHGITYVALEGKGAYRNGEKMCTSETKSLEEALVGLDINSYNGNFTVKKVSDLIKKTKHIRHFGANALEISYVGEGLTDAFVDLRDKIRTTDVAAGFLIAKEAGGVVTDSENKPINVKLDPKQTLSFVVSANQHIHKQILSLVKPNV